MPATDELNKGLQLWVNLPRSEKMCEPRYQELLDADIPRAQPEDGVDVKVIAGECFGVKSQVFTKQPTLYLDFKLTEGKEARPSIPPAYNALVYILNGSLYVGEPDQLVEAHHTIVLSRDEGADHVYLRSKDNESCHFVLIAGLPTGEPVVQYGPFVMTTQKEIQETFEDYQMGRNGFERAPGWSASIDHE